MSGLPVDNDEGVVAPFRTENSVPSSTVFLASLTSVAIIGKIV